MSLICLILLFLISTSIDNVYITNIRWYYQSWAFVASTSGSYVFESCHGYPDYTAIDATWKAARAFGIISFILGIVMLVVASISACATSTGQAMLTHVWEAPAYILTAICQGLTLLLLSSNACNSDVLIGLGGRKLKPSVNVFSFSVSIALYSYYAYTIFHSCIQSYYLVPFSPQLQRRYSTLGRLVVCLQELNSLSLLQHFGLLRELWVTMFFLVL